MIASRPALVLRPASEADISAAMAFARDHNLPVSVRGGGHNVAGAALSDGGITIDMTQRRAVTVDPHTMLVRVEAGATWKEVDAATQEQGIVVPSGIISATGVAGLALGGVFGWTSRRCKRRARASPAMPRWSGRGPPAFGRRSGPTAGSFPHDHCRRCQGRGRVNF